MVGRAREGEHWWDQRGDHSGYGRGERRYEEGSGEVLLERSSASRSIRLGRT